MAHHSAGPTGEGEQRLPGGSMGGAVRVGATVRRPAGPWSPTIQRLLHHLRAQGLAWVPEPLGLDERGRDVVTYLTGVVPAYPLPGWVWSDDVLTDAARHLAQLHDATAGFDTSGAVWRLPAHEPAEVVCHNDVAPHNMVFVDGRLTGVVDWDTASPGPRVRDLAYLAYRLVPLTGPDGAGDAAAGDLARRADRLRRLCVAYGPGARPADVVAAAVPRLVELAAFTAARADAGQEELRAHAALYRRDARWIAAYASALAPPPTTPPPIDFR